MAMGLREAMIASIFAALLVDMLYRSVECGFYKRFSGLLHKLNHPILQALSSNALELLYEYNPWIERRTVAVQIFYPPHYKEKHYNEEYRPAWEELYREIALDGVYATKINLIGVSTNVLSDSGSRSRFDGNKGITAALSEIASTNSIPMLTDVYTRLLGENQYENQARQRDIFGILLHIDSAEALDAVFTLLDLTENKVGAEYAAALRDSLENDFRQALKKRKNLNAYKNPNLSVNNQALLERARQVETELPATQQASEE